GPCHLRSTLQQTQDSDPQASCCARRKANCPPRQRAQFRRQGDGERGCSLQSRLRRRLNVSYVEGLPSDTILRTRPVHYFLVSSIFKWVKVSLIPNRRYQSMAAATPMSNGVRARQPAKSLNVFDGSSNIVYVSSALRGRISTSWSNFVPRALMVALKRSLIAKSAPVEM